MSRVKPAPVPSETKPRTESPKPALKRAKVAGASSWTPLEFFAAQRDPLTAERQMQWLWGFLALGVALRIIRYLLRFPLWEDEAMLSANYIDRGYLELLKPLTYHQIAPPLFLWGQLTMVKLLGFSEYVLRFIPFVCSLGSLFLFRHLAGRLLRGSALVVAVGLFAVSYPMVRYAAEAKPYGCDLFLSLVMMTLVVEWFCRPQETRWLWILAAMIVPTVGYSFPAAFIGGGLSVVVGIALVASKIRNWRARRNAAADSPAAEPPAAGWIAWTLFNLLMVGGFVGLVAVTRIAVGTANESFCVNDWLELLPPIHEPLKLLRWFFEIHCGGMLAYPLGGPNWASSLSFVLCLVGLGVLVMRRQWALLGMFLVPLVLNFVAAALHRYPYGTHIRMSLYIAAGITIVLALGMTAALALVARRQPLATRPMIVGLSLLVALALGQLGRDLISPYKSGTTLRAREFAQWFWFDLAHDSEVVCTKTDLKEDLSPGTFEWGWSALYLCNQQIYSPRHHRGQAAQLDHVTADHPLRCVLFRSSTEERGTQNLERWLARMEGQYDLAGHDRFPFPIYDKHEHGPRQTDFVEVFKFVPRPVTALRDIPFDAGAPRTR